MPQLVEEKQDAVLIEPVSVEKMDYACKYSDEFYLGYIENFITNPKKRRVFRFIKRFGDIFVSAAALLLKAGF